MPNTKSYDILSINAVTLATSNMMQAIKFYKKIGFVLFQGGIEEMFTSFKVGESQILNITIERPDFRVLWWGRIIFYVSDVDILYQHIIKHGLNPDFAPRDAAWNERYFHITDPDGHELSFAQRIT